MARHSVVRGDGAGRATGRGFVGGLGFVSELNWAAIQPVFRAAPRRMRFQSPSLVGARRRADVQGPGRHVLADRLEGRCGRGFGLRRGWLAPHHDGPRDLADPRLDDPVDRVPSQEGPVGRGQALAIVDERRVAVPPGLGRTAEQIPRPPRGVAAAEQPEHERLDEPVLEQAPAVLQIVFAGPRAVETCTTGCELEEELLARNGCVLAGGAADGRGQDEDGACDARCCRRSGHTERGDPRVALPGTTHDCKAHAGCTRGARTKPGLPADDAGWHACGTRLHRPCRCATERPRSRGGRTLPFLGSRPPTEPGNGLPIPRLW
jgi:hypothetical protein